MRSKAGVQTYGVGENAIFMPGNTDPQYSQWLAFSGTSVDPGRRPALPGLANAKSCWTVYIPTAISDLDVSPSASGPHQVDPGMGVSMTSM